MTPQRYAKPTRPKKKNDANDANDDDDERLQKLLLFILLRQNLKIFRPQFLKIPINNECLHHQRET